jgi:phage terminase large subunit-like protein
MNWNAANAVVVKNPAGDRKFDKAKATGRIDGMVAAAMTMGRVAAKPDDSDAFDAFLSAPARA